MTNSLKSAPWHTHIYIASDHGGVELKQYLLDVVQKKYCGESGVKNPSLRRANDNPKDNDAGYVTDLGVMTKESVDYPNVAAKMAGAIQNHPGSCGIILCGSGVGVSIAMNRFSFIRAVLVSDPVTAALSRRHNDANVMCLGARLVGEVMAQSCVHAFLSEAFEGGRHDARVAMLSTL